MHTMHLLSSEAIQPNLELKTRPKQLLGSLPLVIALPAFTLATLVPNSLNFLTKIFYNFDPKIVFSNCRRFFVGFRHKKVSEKVEKKFLIS
jgi:hypothetical protein